MQTATLWLYYYSANLTIGVVGVDSVEAFGTPTVLDASPKTIVVNGVASNEAFGTPAVGAPVSVQQLAAAGAFTIRRRPIKPPKLALTVSLRPHGIRSGEAFGTPAVAAEMDFDAMLLKLTDEDAALLELV